METKTCILMMIAVIAIFGVTAINTTTGAVCTGVFVGRMVYCLIRDRKERKKMKVSNNDELFHRAAEILAGYHLDPVDDEYERLVDWIHGNRLSADRYSASERERRMWEFLRRHGWSSADLHHLSDDATQGG